MKNYYISDLHFSHPACAVKYRDFPNEDVMDEFIIEKFNSIVTPKDVTHIIGDFAWKRPQHFLDRLNGRFVLIRGNHDNKSTFKKLAEHPKVNTIKMEWYKTKVGGVPTILCHYCMATWNCSCYGSWHLHGHHHSGWTLPEGKIMNVTAEALNYLPVCEEQVVEYMKKRSQNYDYVSPEDRGKKITERPCIITSL